MHVSSAALQLQSTTRLVPKKNRDVSDVCLYYYTVIVIAPTQRASFRDYEVLKAGECQINTSVRKSCSHPVNHCKTYAELRCDTGASVSACSAMTSRAAAGSPL